SLWSGGRQHSVPGIASTGRAAIAVGALQQVAPRERARQVACRQRAEVDWLPVPQTQSAHRCGEVWSCAQISWPLSCCGVGVLAYSVRSRPERLAPQELIQLCLRESYHCLLASACPTSTPEGRAGGDECCCLGLGRTIEPLFHLYGLIENFSVGTHIRNAQAVLTLEFWFLFPVAITIAIFAMATGVSGANFFAPVYLLWLQLDPQLGFWLSLVSMLFGFSSGLIRNLLQGTV